MSEIHNGHPVRNMLNNTQVMGNKNIGHSHFLLKVLQQVDNLGLNGHIQGAGGLVANQDFRLQRQRPGDADTLARAKNTSVAALAAKGVLSAEKGIVRLLTREELPEKVDPREESIWLLCQQLTRAMETGGVEACAQIVAPMLGSNAERAKDLAYRLYTLAERKGWTQEGYAYNALVVAWREIQSRAAELQQATPEQTSFF